MRRANAFSSSARTVVTPVEYSRQVASKTTSAAPRRTDSASSSASMRKPAAEYLRSADGEADETSPPPPPPSAILMDGNPPSHWSWRDPRRLFRRASAGVHVRD